MSDKIYDVPAEWTKRAFVNESQYRKMYERSLADPNGFWAEQADRKSTRLNSSHSGESRMPSSA